MNVDTSMQLLINSDTLRKLSMHVDTLRQLLLSIDICSDDFHNFSHNNNQIL